MKKTKLIMALFLISIIIIPTVSAVWWNPFTWKWFNNLFKQSKDFKGIKDIEECNTVYRDETKQVPHTERVWYENNQTWDDTVIYSTVKETLSSTTCEKIGININNREKIMFDDYYCSHDNKIAICDSKNDGNGDGICQSGESCFKITINKDGTLTKLEKNSRDDFVESDKSFVLKKRIKVKDLE